MEKQDKVEEDAMSKQEPLSGMNLMRPYPVRDKTGYLEQTNRQIAGALASIRIAQGPPVMTPISKTKCEEALSKLRQFYGDDVEAMRAVLRNTRNK